MRCHSTVGSTQCGTTTHACVGLPAAAVAFSFALVTFTSAFNLRRLRRLARPCPILLVAHDLVGCHIAGVKVPHCKKPLLLARRRFRRLYQKDTTIIPISPRRTSLCAPASKRAFTILHRSGQLKGSIYQIPNRPKFSSFERKPRFQKIRFSRTVSRLCDETRSGTRAVALVNVHINIERKTHNTPSTPRI